MFNQLGVTYFNHKLLEYKCGMWHCLIGLIFQFFVPSILFNCHTGMQVFACVVKMFNDCLQKLLMFVHAYTGVGFCSLATILIIVFMATVPLRYTMPSSASSLAHPWRACDSLSSLCLCFSASGQATNPGHMLAPVGEGTSVPPGYMLVPVMRPHDVGKSHV